MKFSIDTKTKTIELQEEVIIDELLIVLEEMNIDYTEYKLIPFQVNTYTYPWYVPNQSPTTYPWQSPFVYGTTTSASTNAYNTIAGETR